MNEYIVVMPRKDGKKVLLKLKPETADLLPEEIAGIVAVTNPEIIKPDTEPQIRKHLTGFKKSFVHGEATIYEKRTKKPAAKRGKSRQTTPKNRARRANRNTSTRRR